MLELSSNDRPDVRVEVTLNNTGEVSIVDSSIVWFSYFNIAEGYSQGELLKGVAALMSGDYVIERTLFGGRRAVVTLGDREVYGKVHRPKRASRDIGRPKMVEPYMTTLLRQLQKDATTAGVPWKEVFERGSTYFDLDNIEIQLSDLGSVEFEIYSPSSPLSRSLYCLYLYKVDPDNMSEVRELFSLYLSGKLFELKEGRRWSVEKLIVQRDDGGYYDLETKRDVRLHDTSTVTPILTPA
ncbi:hypothetical protein [Raineyella sp. W15-4]|uniref:hypothetical protein n=1 Tax=Raineyella sp. W15-4 TaxID=3081651 RepID=UPI002954B79A|nr:hypothetical protein [Raineyella sp. W15-4]WOQ18322.1 hypothetical protein R0145_06440 [Raineyella sp. W15-4]